MTPTGARNTIESVLRQHAPFTEFWHVRAERERRCCWDPSCTKPRHALGGKIRVRVFPWAFNEATEERLAEVERTLSQHLDGVVQTKVIPLGAAGNLRPAVWIWLD